MHVKAFWYIGIINLGIRFGVVFDNHPHMLLGISSQARVHR